MEIQHLKQSAKMINEYEECLMLYCIEKKKKLDSLKCPHVKNLLVLNANQAYSMNIPQILKCCTT